MCFRYEACNFQEGGTSLLSADWRMQYQKIRLQSGLSQFDKNGEYLRRIGRNQYFNLKHTVQSCVKTIITAQVGCPPVIPRRGPSRGKEMWAADYGYHPD